VQSAPETQSSGTVHLIHGYLCSGKTTFAKQLEQRSGGVRVSLDEWMIRLTGENVRHDDEIYERLYALMAEIWPRIVVAGVDVVLDYGFWKRARRDDARAAATQLGAPHRLYWVRCPDIVARARCRERADATGDVHYYIDDKAFDVLRTKYESLAPDEPYELIET
jgi:predicted kinase